MVVGDSVKYPLERWDVLPKVYLSTIRQQYLPTDILKKLIVMYDFYW